MAERRPRCAVFVPAPAATARSASCWPGSRRAVAGGDLRGPARCTRRLLLMRRRRDDRAAARRAAVLPDRSLARDRRRDRGRALRVRAAGRARHGRLRRLQRDHVQPGTGTWRSPWCRWSPSRSPATLGNELPRFPGRLTAIFAILPAGAAGLGIRVLRRRLADSTARLRRAADEAEAATERALTAERARIASELHDVVTHNVSVMIVQAGAARKILASSPADAEDALLAVEATGREAMTELRNLLGLLSPAADGDRSARGRRRALPRRRVSRPAGTAAAPAALRPQPGLGELDALIGRVRAAGLTVTLTVTRDRPAATAGRGPGRLPGRAGGAHQRAAARRAGRGVRRGALGRPAGAHRHRRRPGKRAAGRMTPRTGPGTWPARAPRAARAVRR